MPSEKEPLYGKAGSSPQQYDKADKYADFFEHAPIGNFVLGDHGVIEEVNLEGASLLAGERREILRRSFTDFVMPEDIETWRRCFLHPEHASGQKGREMLLKRIDGKIFHARMNCRHAQLAGVPTVNLVLADISRQKRRGKRTMDWKSETDELKEMQIAFHTAAAIAHELNQPLLAIASYSKAVLALLKSDKPDLVKIAKAIASSERQAQRAGKSIHELLDFLSIKEITLEALDLNETVRQVVAAVRLEEEYQFESILTLEDRLPQVVANRTHVEKVLFNLIRNGIEAMLESDVPRPSMQVSVHTKIDVHSAQVTIRDNGPGIREEHLHRLFKPFFTTKSKGVGMGLAVSRSLVEANGGRLWHDAQESPGATFHLTLPFAS